MVITESLVNRKRWIAEYEDIYPNLEITSKILPKNVAVWNMLLAIKFERIIDLKMCFKKLY